MTTYAPRLLLGLLAAVTLVLSAGGSLGLWPTGAPAARDGDARPVAVGGRVPVQPYATGTTGSSAPAPTASTAPTQGGGAVDDADDTGGRAPEPTSGGARTDPADRAEGSSAAADSGASESDAAESDVGESDAADVALPADSGSGRRVVFDMSDQRVWLVGGSGAVRRSYPVSGSVHDNLSPGSYEVYSRSPNAVSYDYAETMRYMVRFAHGENAAIGFHDIPVDQQGHRVQTRAQLGTPLSSGCVRQTRPDALALWRFAGIGTSVVVTA